jgi:poly(beta-D-mannuronate) lyase
MAAGTTLCLADGNYTHLELNFGGAGTAENPITVAAENPGQVTVGGKVGVRMSGSYVVLQGFIFKDGESASSDFLQTRGNNAAPCNHCRITEIAIINLDQGRDLSGRWINIYGQHNRIDHSWFSGKTTRGALLVVDRYVASGDDPLQAEIDYTQIDHNYFGNRPPINGKAYAGGGDNEYEGIRIGTSDSHMADSFSVVEHNYFERIEGEAEVISNKSGGNRIEHNTVRDSYGSITTRHGANAIIANNFILGDDHPYAGGIRIVDDGHQVINNYIQGARFQDTSHHGGIVLMGSDGSTTNGYQQLTNVLVAHNTIVDSVNSLNVDGGGKPTNPNTVYLINNIIVSAIGPVITQAAGGMPASSEIVGNLFHGQAFSDSASLTSVPGISFIDTALTRDSLGIWRPGDKSPDLTATSGYFSGAFDTPVADMDGTVRTAETQSGADHISDDAPTRGLLNYYDVGPISYRPPVTAPHVKKVHIANHDFDYGTDGWDISNAVLTENEAEVFSRGRSIKFTSAGGEVAQTVTLEPNTHYTLSAFVKGPGILVAEVDGEQFVGRENTSSKYRFTRVSFNSGDVTSAKIYGV